VLLRWLRLSPSPVQEEISPYHLRDDFLSPAELSFYHVLQSTVADWAVVVCPKVSLGDLFFAKTGDYGQNRSWMNRIDRKHVDFLLCELKTVRPMLGIELDDASHRKTKREERDQFVEQVFAAAGLPLARVSVQAQYNTRELEAYLRHTMEVATTAKVPGPSEHVETTAPPTGSGSPASPPACPKCGAPMILRVVKREGPRKGTKFWGCPNFPKCRGIREVGDD